MVADELFTGPEPDYRDLVESAGDIIYTLDVEGRFTFVNRAGLRVFGYNDDEADQILGEPFLAILTPRSQRIALDHFKRGIQGEAVPPFFEVEAVRKDGSTVHLEVRAGSIYRDRSLVGRQGVARDISELKALQAEVAEKSERLALLEQQARIASDLYGHIAQLAVEVPHNPHENARVLREVRGALVTAAASKLSLSPTDLAIIELVARGRSNREIGDTVHLSANTIKDRLSKIMHTLNAHSRSEVAAEATRRGLIV